MKKLLVFLPLALLVGCAHPISKIEVPDINRSDAVVIKDLRPANEKQNEIFSLSITSEAYAIYRKGDETLQPPMVRLLQHRAFEKFGQPMEITVHHMVAYLNLKSGMRRSVLGSSLGGVVGAAIASGAESKYPTIASSLADRAEFDSLADKEHRRSFFTEKENPEKASVFVTYIDAEIKGKRAFTKTMSPATAGENQNAQVIAIEGAIQYFLSQY